MTGVQKVSYDILSSLDSSYDKYVIFGGGYDASEDFMSTFRDAGIKVIRVKYLRRDIGVHDVKCFFELYNLFRLESFDIVHTNSTKPGVIARIAAKIAGCKSVIHTVHGISFHKFEPNYKRVIYFLLEYISSFFSDVLISVNNYYLKYYPLINPKFVVHNSILKPEHNPVVERDNLDKLSIGFLSRLDHQKDPITLLKAINHIETDLPDYRGRVKVIFGGDGELLDECKRYASNNNIQSCIEFVGWVDNKQDFFENIDVFCLPSIFEAFGLVLLEAGWFSKPTIATNVEGIPEVIIDNRTGLLVDPRDYKALAKSIIYFLDNPEQISVFGLRAHQNVSKNFTFEKMIKKYHSIYQNL
jgi:glycosyltransferase involved in cell wall biosynthesis